MCPEHQELVDSMLSSIPNEDITSVHDPLVNFPPENSTHFSKREKVYGVLTPIGLGIAGPGIGALVGALLCKFGVIAASVATGACVGVGVGAGLGLLFGVGIVGVYFLWKQYSKK